VITGPYRYDFHAAPVGEVDALLEKLNQAGARIVEVLDTAPGVLSFIVSVPEDGGWNASSSYRYLRAPVSEVKDTLERLNRSNDRIVKVLHDEAALHFIVEKRPSGFALD
jgi:hypothetical protein